MMSLIVGVHETHRRLLSEENNGDASCLVGVPSASNTMGARASQKCLFELVLHAALLSAAVGCKVVGSSGGTRCKYSIKIHRELAAEISHQGLNFDGRLCPIFPTLMASAKRLTADHALDAHYREVR
jgi:hypothetical protein